MQNNRCRNDTESGKNGKLRKYTSDKMTLNIEKI